MPLFDAYPDTRTDDDGAVLCHELGHAVAWFRYEGAVGSIRICREQNTQGLNADILLLPRDGHKETQETADYRIPFTTRLLAADVAYRKRLGLEEGLLSLRGFPKGSEFRVEEILWMLEEGDREDDDVYKILSKAVEADADHPEEWLSNQLSESIALVKANWSAISAIAARLEVFLPGGGQKVWVPGTNLISWMLEAGVQPGKAPPVELVDRTDPLSLGIRIARFSRKLLGVHDVLSV